MTTPAAIFKPPLSLRNAHLQNLLSSTGLRRNILAKRHQHLLATTETFAVSAQNGVRLLADFTMAGAQPSAIGLAIVVHGWEGSSASNYVVSLTATLLAAGCDVLRLNMRDHNNSHHLNRGIFNSSLIDEVVEAIAQVMNDRPYPRYLLAGFSLGGNFALRVGLRSEQLPAPLAAIAAVCPVVNPPAAMRAMTGGLGLYDRYFTAKWKRSLQKKLRHFPDYGYGAALASMQGLVEMNDYFIPRYTGFRTVEEYFASYTLSAAELAHLRTPSLLIAAIDDPVIPIADIQALRRCPALQLDIQRYGSHCAFLYGLGRASWADLRVLRYFQSSVASPPAA